MASNDSKGNEVSILVRGEGQGNHNFPKEPKILQLLPQIPIINWQGHLLKNIQDMRQE